MKKIVWFLAVIFLCSFFACATMSGGMKNLPEPEPDTLMIMGCLLLENIDQDFGFDYFDFPMKVVILGQNEEGVIDHYILSTDQYGYYCLPNVPKGSYILKAVIFQMPGERPNIIVNDYEYPDSKFYLTRHPERGVEYTSNWFGSPPTERIINQNITWFGLKRSNMEDRNLVSIGEVLLNFYSKDLENERIMTDGHPYRRLAPLTHFKNAFPESNWWNE
ncbi:hypothetical protein ACFL6A_01230 [bacterium]